MSDHVFDPVLDRPKSIDYADLVPGARYPLGNGDVIVETDGDSDLYNLFWPWADKVYAHSIRVHVRDLHDDEFTPLVTRFFPGYQETIIGTEGIIVSKRLALPYKSNDDRAVMWLFGCQAEGDRLLRLDVEIDWGEPLSQRMVDGLLVAQENPQAAQGLYKQHNADTTRVFGNPQARPTEIDIDDPQRAQLTYYVLVNGEVDVPLLLTISDVGEQVAWNGFLALRDAERVFDLSNSEWNKLLSAGRVWTSDPRLNRMFQDGKLSAVRGLQRLRTGMAATDRVVVHTAGLIDILDSCEPVQSRNILANLRRLAEKTGGRIPETIPLSRKEQPADPGAQIVATTVAYITALGRHLAHHFDLDLLNAHRTAITRCADMLIAERVGAGLETPAKQHAAGQGLRYAAFLAETAGWRVDAARWESDARLLGAYDRPVSDSDPGWFPDPLAPPARTDAGEPNRFDDTGTRSAASVGGIFWKLCGLQRKPDGSFSIRPRQGVGSRWWALLNLPYQHDRKLSMVWDGHLLHTTSSVESNLPLAVHDAIHALHADEYEFDLQFEFVDNLDGEPQRARFHPIFLTADTASNS